MATSIHILIVDDETRFLQTLADRLEIRNFKVSTAANAFQALEKAEACPPEIALVDLKMPGMDGEALLRRLKEHHPQTEVVILTGHGSEASKQRCEEAGSHAYLHKPCETDELAAVLRSAFEKRMMRRLHLEKRELEVLINRLVGESSFRAILQLKELEEQLLARQQDPSSHID
jgi:DNA-binding response OmpR family regulator